MTFRFRFRNRILSCSFLPQCTTRCGMRVVFTSEPADVPDRAIGGLDATPGPARAGGVERDTNGLDRAHR